MPDPTEVTKPEMLWEDADTRYVLLADGRVQRQDKDGKPLATSPMPKPADPPPLPPTLDEAMTAHGYTHFKEPPVDLTPGQARTEKTLEVIRSNMEKADAQESTNE